MDKNWSSGAGDIHPVTTGEALILEGSFVEEKPLYLGFVLFWDQDIIGVHCPFCLSTETHLMRPLINKNSPFSNPIWHKDMRAADCQPGMSFRLLFPFDRLAMDGLGSQWAPENKRWETSGLKEILFKEVKKGNEEEAEMEGIMTEEPHYLPSPRYLLHHTNSAVPCIDYNCCSPQKERIIPSNEVLPIAADTSPGPPVDLSNYDGDKAVISSLMLTQNAEMLAVVSRLYNNPPPEYLSFGHGRASIVYRPVAVIPVLGQRQKTVGFLAPTASSTRRVFTRSGWRGQKISNADVAWLQGILATPKEAPWQELEFINNGDYTDKVREVSAYLGQEPKPHYYDLENPIGQVCFSHVEKQLVIVALEEYQPSGHISRMEPLIRTIYLDRAPCVGCLDFAKAVERRTSLRFTFNVMTRVMSDEQARKKTKTRDPGKENVAMEEEGDKEADESADESADDEMPADDRRYQGRRSLKTTGMDKKRQPAGKELRGVYEVSAILNRRVIDGELEYLVDWKEMWLNGTEFEAQLRLYAKQLHVVCEVTGRRGERERLVRWPESWESHEKLNNSRELVEEYEREKGLVE